MFDLSPIQIILVLVIALIALGPKRLPEMARSLGRSLTEFKGAMSLDGDSTPAREARPARPAPAPAPAPPPAPTAEEPAPAAAPTAPEEHDVDDLIVRADRPASPPPDDTGGG